MNRLSLPGAWLLCGLAMAFVPAGADAHQDGCHSSHTCPSDHHSYVWYDASGVGYDCVKPGAPEYNSATDTTVVTYAGLTYYCRIAGSSTPTPPPPVDTDADGVPDSQDACPTVPGLAPGGCPAPPVDSDADGTPDNADACPSQAGPAPTGCPAAPVAPTYPLSRSTAVLKITAYVKRRYHAKNITTACTRQDASHISCVVRYRRNGIGTKRTLHARAYRDAVGVHVK